MATGDADVDDEFDRRDVAVHNVALEAAADRPGEAPRTTFPIVGMLNTQTGH